MYEAGAALCVRVPVGGWLAAPLAARPVAPLLMPAALLPAAAGPRRPPPTDAINTVPQQCRT